MLSCHHRITWRRNIAENFNRLISVQERYRRQTDDRQTDGRTTTNSEHEHEFTFAKNGATPLFIAAQNGHTEIMKLLLASHSTYNVGLQRAYLLYIRGVTLQSARHAYY